MNWVLILYDSKSIKLIHYIFSGSWKELFHTKENRKAFFIVQLCSFTKYMGGMSALCSYVFQTLSESSIMYFDQNQLTIAVGIIMTLSTLGSSLIPVSFGRRPVFIGSCLSSSIFLIVIGGYYFFEFETLIDVGPYIWILYVSLSGFIIAVNVGLSPLMQTIQAEFFSSKTRGTGGALTLVFSATFTFCCIKQYQILQVYPSHLNYNLLLLHDVQTSYYCKMYKLSILHH